MTHTEWRAFGFGPGGPIAPTGGSEVFYNAIGADWTILRVLVSVQLTVPVIEDGLTPAIPFPIMCQVDNFGGDEGTPPPSVNGNPHPLLRFMPTLYPTTAIGVGDVLLPVVTRLWVGGTGREPLSGKGQRDAAGAFGGRHMAFTSQATNGFTGVGPIVGETEYFAQWAASVLVQRTP